MTSSLPANLYNKCSDILVRCDEFDDDRRLSSVFVVQELHPFRTKLPTANSKIERVRLCIDFLMAQKVGENSALIFFLQFLSEMYHPEDMLHVELADIASEVKAALSTSTRKRVSKTKTDTKKQPQPRRGRARAGRRRSKTKTDTKKRPQPKKAGGKSAVANLNITILFLAADPTNASRLRLGEEFREIDEQLKLASFCWETPNGQKYAHDQHVIT